MSDDMMTDVLSGVEASRRAGWAHYYAEKERREAAENKPCARCHDTFDVLFDAACARELGTRDPIGAAVHIADSRLRDYSDLLRRVLQRMQPQDSNYNDIFEILVDVEGLLRALHAMGETP